MSTCAAETTKTLLLQKDILPNPLDIGNFTDYSHLLDCDKNVSDFFVGSETNKRRCLVCQHPFVRCGSQ
jgi:hypothetical protein